jgi:hypothetical protein
VIASLYITLEGTNGKPVTLARVDDRRLLVVAATQAIEQAQARTEQMGAEDEVLGILQGDEADRLRRALERVIPELAQCAAAGAVM